MAVMVATASLPPPPAPRQPQAEQIAAEIDVAVDVDVLVGRPLADQLRALGPQELAGPVIGQPGKPVPEGEFATVFGLRRTCLGLHDGCSLVLAVPCNR